MAIKDNVEARFERWEKRLRSITTQSLTTDYVRPTEGTRIVEAVHSVTLPESAQTALLQLSILDGSNRIPPFTVLLAAFAVLAARLTGDEDISIGTSGENKEPFVLRLPIDAKTSFADLLSTVKNVIAPLTVYLV
jgi:L-aminoadipate-semialdehyde dehydrogenase